MLIQDPILREPTFRYHTSHLTFRVSHRIPEVDKIPRIAPRRTASWSVIARLMQADHAIAHFSH